MISETVVVVVPAPVKTVTVPIVQLNKYFICRVCTDYFIDAHTIIECLHTFCKDCIKKCIEVKNTCPQCKIDLGMDAFKSMIKYDRNIQSLVDKIFPDHASSSATKLVLRQDAKIDLNVLFPDNAPQEETEEEEVEEEPYDVMVRILPMKTGLKSTELPALEKTLLRMKSTLVLGKLARFVAKKLAEKSGKFPGEIDVLQGNRVVAQKRNLGSCIRDKESNYAKSISDHIQKERVAANLQYSLGRIHISPVL